MKILYLAPHLSTGGMPAFLLKTIETLKDDVEICVVEYACHSLDYVVQRNAIMNLVPVHTLHEDKMELFNVIDQFNPDVIHIHEPSERFDRTMITKLYDNDRTYRIVETCHDVSFKPDEEKIFHPDYYAFCTPYHVDTFGNMPSMYSIVEFPIDDCRVSSCLNNGLCNANNDIFECKCSDGFHGNKCQFIEYDYSKLKNLIDSKTEIVANINSSVALTNDELNEIYVIANLIEGAPELLTDRLNESLNSLVIDQILNMKSDNDLFQNYIYPLADSALKVNSLSL
mgnify:CR=1 FL=1